MELTPWVLGKDITKPVRMEDDLEANIRKMDFSSAGGPSAARFIHAAFGQKLDRLLLIGSLWTPPHWMKDGAVIHFRNNSGGGHLKMDADNLEQFGRYVAAYVAGFGRHCGVPFYAISIQNELMFDESYNSCQYTPREYHDAIRAVGRAFQEFGITTKIIGPESIAPGGDFFTGKQLEWIDAVESDPETAPFLSFFCGHGPGDGADDQRNYWDRIKGYGKESWVTEWSGEKPRWIHSDNHDKQDGAMSMAMNLEEILADGNASAAVYWQCSDGKVRLESGNLMGITAESAAESAKYSVARQFFRFIRPGAVRVAIVPEIADLEASAFVQRRDRTLTVELVNSSTQDRQVQLTLPPDPPVSAFEVFRTSAFERCAAQPDLHPINGVVNFTIPPQSLVTLYGK